MITRHGHPIAQLTAIDEMPAMTVQEAIDGILELRKGTTLGPGLTIRDLIEEGRR